jgi:hypothetical protein
MAKNRVPQGSVSSRPINMTGQPAQGPSQTMRPSPGSVTPKPMTLGSGLSDDPIIEPVRGPNSAFAIDGKLPTGNGS